MSEAVGICLSHVYEVSQWRGSLYRTVGKFVTVKASGFNKAQRLSTNGLQQIQYQSLKNNKFQ